MVPGQVKQGFWSSGKAVLVKYFWAFGQALFSALNHSGFVVDVSVRHRQLHIHCRLTHSSIGSPFSQLQQPKIAHAELAKHEREAAKLKFGLSAASANFA